jgi:N-acetylglucosaminyl-diphospho-decaprenol L-rhamnosyltransferase
MLDTPRALQYRVKTADEHASRKSTSNRIYIVVPVHNRKSLTERFLYCMSKQTFRNFEVTIVDDGSTDGTAELIAERFKEVRLIRGDGNLWWTGATNVGIQHAMKRAAEDDAVLVINDDVEVSPDYLQILYGVWRSRRKTLIGSVVVDIKKPDIIYDGGRIVNWWTAKTRWLNLNKKLSDFGKDYSVDVSFLTGWGTLIPISVFRDVGLYDDKHFQQCGDIELPVRAKNAGYHVVVSYAPIVKIHTDPLDGGKNACSCYSLRDLSKYFFDIKSNFRLKYRFFFSLKTARNPLAFVSFLLFDFVRITWHFLVRLRF